jgi:hypothetical protein
MILKVTTYSRNDRSVSQIPRLCVVNGATQKRYNMVFALTLNYELVSMS